VGHVPHHGIRLRARLLERTNVIVEFEPIQHFAG